MKTAVDRFIRGCVYSAKNIGRDGGFLFWAAAYPLILAFLFNLAFSGLLEGELELEKIKVGISKQNPYQYIIEQVQVLDPVAMTEEEATTALEEKKISGFIDEQLNITVLESGGKQTLIKEITDYIKQVYAMELPYDRFHFDKNYIKRVRQKEEGASVIFYSMIAMVSLYGIYGGIAFVQGFQGNLSPLGARIQGTPIRKKQMLLSSFSVCTFFNLLCNLLLLLFMRYVLQLRLFYDLPRSLLLIGMGNVLGTALGIFISASNKMSENAKTMISVGITLVLSFTSGMNGASFKIWIKSHLPMFHRLNPISLMTDTFYRINLLSDVQGYVEVLGLLFVQTVIFLGLSYVFLRREQYDSL